MTSKTMAERGELLVYENGKVITLQELMQREQGRPISWQEAEQEVGRARFIKRLTQKYANKN